MDSEESDFYGDDETVAALGNRVDQFNVNSWRSQHQSHSGRPAPRKELMRDRSKLHNPYAGVHFAWQLTETVDDFLARLPPRITSQSQVPWIFICNPYVPRLAKGRNEGWQAEVGRGNEDEAPSEEGSQISVAMQGAQERLEILSTFVRKAESMSKSKAMAEKEVNKERKQAAADILSLAHAAKVRAGKWMLFCSSQDVNHVWAIVATATAANELGIAAKVAPKPVDDDTRRDRLICVYTADFQDKADVGRVLQKLRELKLVEARSRAIYYKPDAFTYIGIASGNPWGIKASIYSSMDVFPG